jgi:hypothetical protein
VIGDLRPPKETLEGISYQVTDVTQWKSLVSLFDYCVKQHGQLDIVFANVSRPAYCEPETLLNESRLESAALKTPSLTFWEKMDCFWSQNTLSCK